MSQKELFFRWRAWAACLLLLLGLVWLTPWGLKWLLVQQLQQVLKREVTVQAVSVNPFSLSLRVQGLSVKHLHGGEEFVGWQQLTLDVSAQSLSQRAWVLDALTLQSPRVSVTHLGQGRFDFLDLLERPQSEASSSLPPFVLRQVSIHEGRVRLHDQPYQRTHTVDDVQLALPLVSSVAGKNGLLLTPELSATVNGAPVHLRGTWQPLADQPQAVLALTLKALDITGVQAYLPDTLPMRLISGQFSTDLKLRFSQTAQRTTLMLNGMAEIENFSLHDAQDRPLLSFKTLGLTMRDSDVFARQFVFSDVWVQEPLMSVRIHHTGQLNGAAADEPVLSLSIDQVSLRGGRLDFVDVSVTPKVQTSLTKMDAVLKNFSTNKATQAEFKLKANMGLAPLEVQGHVKPMAVTSFLDAKLQAKNVDLSRWSGYAQKYVGHPLKKGLLSMDARYRIEDKKLQADHHVWIDHLTLGEQVPSPDAIDVPVSLGVSLLKNIHGQIDIELPISGTVDAPEFSLGGLIAQTFGNVLLKVVTAPVRALGDLIGGGRDEKSNEAVPASSQAANALYVRQQ